MIIDVSAVLALAGELKAHSVAAPALAVSIVAEVGQSVQNDAMASAPWDTGELMHDINLKMSGSVNPMATISSDSDHGGYVEFGTSSMAAQPYLMPAFDVGARLLAADLQQIAVML